MKLVAVLIFVGMATVTTVTWLASNGALRGGVTVKIADSLCVAGNCR